MNDTPTATTPFWRFSLKYYGQAGVSDACIALQDGCGVDVNLLLFLFWLASERQALSADEVKKLDATIKSWRELTIIPIRDTRRKLKGAKTFVDPAKQEALRDKVKAVELEAEKLSRKRFTPSPSPGRWASRPSRRPRRAAMSLPSSARWARAFPRLRSTFWLTHSTA